MIDKKGKYLVLITDLTLTRKKYQILIYGN